MKNLILKILSYLIVLAIFFFLGRTLAADWQTLKDYDLVFNYLYLALAFLGLILSILCLFFIWNKILRILEPDKHISYFKASQISIYSWFGRYVPGKIWMLLGRIYLGEKAGLSRKALSLSVIYELILSVASAFLFSLVFVGIAFGARLSALYAVPAISVLGGLVFAHPRVFLFFSNFVLKRLKRKEIALNDFLGYWDITRIIIYYFAAHFLNGVSFFFLIRALVHLPVSDMIGVIGGFNLAATLGVVAIFAPSGLGVREGVLVGFLRFYFPASLAIVVSLVARVWATLGEIGIFIFIYSYSKFIRHD